MEWKSDPDINKMKMALKNCYMLAKRKRTVVHRYLENGQAVSIGPKSEDADWDHIIRFCEGTGLRMSIIKTV